MVAYCKNDTDETFGKRMDLQSEAIHGDHTCNYNWYENWILYEVFWIARRIIENLSLETEDGSGDHWPVDDEQDLRELADEALEGCADIEKYPVAVQLMAAHKLLETRTNDVFYLYPQPYDYKYERQFPELFGLDRKPKKGPIKAGEVDPVEVLSGGEKQLALFE